MRWLRCACSLGTLSCPRGWTSKSNMRTTRLRRNTRSPAEAGSARLRELLTTVLDLLGVEAKIRIVETAEALTADITGDDLGILIGKRGQTIDALEYVANVALYPNPAARKQVRIDAEGYKKRRQAGIERIAVRKAEEVVKRGRPVQLEPMTAAERKIVHLALKEWREVVTESRGREPSRAVVISPVR